VLNGKTKPVKVKKLKLSPGVYLASNRNEYQKQKNYVSEE
jgi:hypothetical protein